MTLEELYAMMGGNYEHAKQIMKMDKLIDRYVRKLKSSGVGDALEAAGETMDEKQLFDSAHALRGVCANLGLDDLARSADIITEEFRAGNSRKMSDEEVKATIQAILSDYRHAVDCITQYEAGN